MNNLVGNKPSSATTSSLHTKLNAKSMLFASASRLASQLLSRLYSGIIDAMDDSNSNSGRRASHNNHPESSKAGVPCALILLLLGEQNRLEEAKEEQRHQHYADADIQGQKDLIVSHTEVGDEWDEPSDCIAKTDGNATRQGSGRVRLFLLVVKAHEPVHHAIRRARQLSDDGFSLLRVKSERS